MVSNLDEYFVEEKTGYDKLIDFLVFIAVFVVTIFLILELVGDSGHSSINIDRLGDYYFWINIAVFIIFVVDLIRLWIQSDGPKDFFRNNWLDILATIPFGLIAAATGPSFEVLKLVRLGKLSAMTKVSKVSKVSRVSKISKEFKGAAHLKKESESYAKKHRL